MLVFWALYFLRVSHLLMQISPEDIQWEGEDPGVSRRGGYGGSGHGMNRPVGRDNVPGAVRGRGVGKGQSRKDFVPSQNGIGKKAPDDIQIRHTASLIKEASENSLIYIRNYHSVDFWYILFFYWNWTGGEGIWCKSSWSSWDWESKESLEGWKSNHVFLLYPFFLIFFFFLSFFFPKANCINNLLFFTIQEQEQALIDAISRLADISDGESGTSLSFLYHL